MPLGDSEAFPFLCYNENHYQNARRYLSTSAGSESRFFERGCGTPMKEREIDELIRQYLAEREIRYTGGRRAVVRALQIAGGPQSAAELHQRLRHTIPLSSLYRSLAMLEEAGLLAVHHGQGRVARYELAEWLSGHHHHVVCLECGAMGDFELDTRAEKELLGLVAVAGRKAGYQVRGHSLEVEGLCGSCR